VSIVIREGDLEADAEAIATALKLYLTPLADHARFDWLYKRNPHGQVRVWLAFEGNSQLVGTAAAFPRRAYMAQEQKEAWVFGDFCVSDRYRSLGPAIALQRQLLQAASANRVFVSYDFPSPAMAAVYKRLKIEPASRMIRLAKMLRMDRKAPKWLRDGMLGGVLTSAGNAFLRVTSCRGSIDPTIETSLVKGKCGSEFDALADNETKKFGFCVQRSSDYLNWRYLENPYKAHEIMTATREGNLLAYVIFSQSGQDGELVDLFGVDDDSVIGRLINEVVELFRCRDAITVSAELIAAHPWRRVFKKFGFYPREDKPFVLYTSKETAPLVMRNGVGPLSCWFITGGDRDS
jgi:hypothetical protein